MPPRKRQAAAKKKTGSDVVQRALLTIGVDETKLSNQTVDQGWRVIRQTFRGACLTKHPDKGGDAAEFIALLESFEVVKKAYEMRGFQSFVEFFSMGRAKKKKTTTRRAKKTTTKAEKTTALAPELMGDMRDVRPISEFYMSALEADVPPYCIERAKSSRSACQMGKRAGKTKYPCTGINLGEGFPSEDEGGTGALVVTGQNLIAKDSIRCGFYVEESASYGFWSHLACWRVPKAFWFEFPQNPGAADWTEQAFMEAFDKMSEVIFTGWTKLSAADKLIVVRHAMRQKHWASFQEKKFIEARAQGVHPRLADTLKTETKKKIAPVADSSSVGKEISSSGKALVKMEEDVEPIPESVVEAPPEVLVPVPNVDGAIAMSLAKTDDKPKRFVLTGIFPELESSTKRISSLNHGKAQATRLIEDFGGVVRTAVSGQTDFLLVGSEPGVRKLTEARDRGVPLIDLAHLLDMIHGKNIAEAPPVEIKKFSTGFRGSGLALDMSREQLDDLRVSAAAIAPPPAEEEVKHLPSTSKEPSPQQSSKKRQAPKTRTTKTKTPKCITNQAQTEDKTASKKRRKR